MLEEEIVIMVGCGETHNFILLRLVEILNLLVTETTNYGVIMGLGKAVQGKGMCMEVTVGLPVMVIVEDFLPLEFGYLDMVLGTNGWENKCMTIN